MEDLGGDYLTTYRQFIKKFVNRIDSLSPEECETPFRLSTFYLVPSEVEAECLEWIRRYLSLHDCPIGLTYQLTRAVYRNFEDSVSLSRFYLKSGDQHNNNSDDEYDELVGNHSQSSSDDDHFRNSSPPQLDAGRLLQEVVCYVHATLRSWNTSLPVLAKPVPLQVCSHAIKNTRRKMEDRHVMIPDLNVLFDLKDSPSQSYFAVFDGHGGLEAAEYAATHLHGHLVNDHKFNTDPEAAMKQAYKTTDIKFLEKAKREGLRSGTTGVSVLIRGSELYVGWLGDSQALLVSSGQPVQIMNPHKPEREDERKRIEDLGGCVLLLGVWRVNGNIAVSRAIGDALHKPFISSDADVTRINMTGEEEYLVLACDGLWDVLTPSQVTNIIYKHSTSASSGRSDVATELVNAARDSDSSDNISVIVVIFKHSLCPPKTANGGSVLLGLSQVSEDNLDKLATSSLNLYSKSPKNEKLTPKANGGPHEGLLKSSFLLSEGSNGKKILRSVGSDSQKISVSLRDAYKIQTTFSQELRGQAVLNECKNNNHRFDHMFTELSLGKAINENTSVRPGPSENSIVESIRNKFFCVNHSASWQAQKCNTLYDDNDRTLSDQDTWCLDMSLLFFLLYKCIR